LIYKKIKRFNFNRYFYYNIYAVSACKSDCFDIETATIHVFPEEFFFFEFVTKDSHCVHASQINLFPFTFIAFFPSWWSSVFNVFVEATATLHLSGSEIMSLLKCYLIIIYSEALVFLSHFRAHALEKLVCLAITHYITALSALSLSPKTSVFKCLEQSEAS
jgi:hypothetical protein